MRADKSSSPELISQLGKTIAVQGDTGSWFEVDPMGREILSRYAAGDEDSIVTQLGPLYGADQVQGFIREYEDSIRPQAAAGFVPGPQYALVNKMYLQVTTQCNLRCRYCYANDPKVPDVVQRMDKTVAFKAVDLLLEENKNEKVCHIDFDGGEPLLNRRLIEDVVSYVEERTRRGGPRVVFTVATNGSTLTDDNVAYLQEKRIACGISFDGGRETQNASRPLGSGQGSFDVIMPVIAPVLQQHRIAGQATATPGSLDVDRTMWDLSGFGFQPVQVEPAYACANNAWKIRPEDMPALLAGYSRAAQDFLDGLGNGDVKPYFAFSEIIKRVHAGVKRHYGCSVGTRLCAVAPDGTMYPCYRFWGRDDYSMGTVDQGFNRSRQEYFIAAHVDNRAGCKQCWARYFCGGKCLFLGIHYHNSIDHPYELNCQVFKHILSLSLAIYATIRSEPLLLQRALASASKSEPRGAGQRAGQPACALSP